MNPCVRKKSSIKIVFIHLFLKYVLFEIELHHFFKPFLPYSPSYLLPSNSSYSALSSR